MKILKNIGLSLLGLIVLLTAVSFVLPRQVHVERSLTMNAPPDAIYEQINTLKNWEKWSPWHQIDPAMKLEYAGPSSGQGASYNWTSNHDEVGCGKLTLLECQANKRIVSEMDFMENGKATGTYVLKPNANGTELTWSMDSDMGYNPIGRWMGLMMEGFVGDDFERGLNNIKQVVEKPTAGAVSLQ